MAYESTASNRRDARHLPASFTSVKAPPRSCTAVFLVCFMTCPWTAGTAHAVVDGDPLSLARVRLDTARAEAEQLNRQLSDAQARRGELEVAIAEAERAIPPLRARVEELEEAVRERAVELYVGHVDRFELVFASASVVKGARAAELTGILAEHTAELAGRLRDTASKLEIREAELAREREELHLTISSLVPLRELLQERVWAASAAYERVADAVHRLARNGTAVDARSGATRCPVDGFVVFADDFHQQRSGGALHQGIDVTAVAGIPVVALVGGAVRHDVGGAGGNAAWLAGTDDVSYYYAHFSRYEGVDRIVEAGEVIGYVGSTGDATGPHLHFEMHPGGGAAVDPYPLLLALCGAETGHDVG
jgi:murein DD-endopeptidase MepM/ murein hydrolase activator NlpD